MSAAITIRFAEKNGSTTLFAAQFVALDKKTDDLYTMVAFGAGSRDAAAPRNGATPPRSYASTRTTSRRKRCCSRRVARSTRASITRLRTSTCIARAEVVTKEFASPPPAAERRDAATPRPVDVPRRGRETGRGDAAARGCAGWRWSSTYNADCAQVPAS